MQVSLILKHDCLHSCLDNMYWYFRFKALNVGKKIKARSYNILSKKIKRKLKAKFIAV